MDDFVINFDASPAVASGSTAVNSKQKGGRWTDRVKDKRRQQGAIRKQQHQPNSASSQPPQNAPSASSSSLGKRARDNHDASAPGSALRPKGSFTIRAGNTTSNGATTNGDQDGDMMIQPRRGPKAAKRPNTNSASASGEASSAKVTVTQGGKKHYISSLFSAEGLPEATPAAPVIPSRPSNAPLRASVAEEQDEEEDLDAAETEVKPDPAPALTTLGLMSELVHHLANKLNITGPTACQAGAIPPLLAGNKVASAPSTSTSTSTSSSRARDAILQAQTGSGKTLAFLLPMLQDLLTLDPSILGPSSSTPTRQIGTLALILAPTRELAAQIYGVLESILSMSGSSSFSFPPRALTPCLLVGGANRTHEKSRLRKGCPIVVATPGRLLDHLRTTESFRMAGEPIKSKGPRGRPGSGANTSELGQRGGDGRKLGLRWLIVDECDRLMDLGFEEQMKGVLEELERRSPSMNVTSEKGKRRTVLCSATASEGVDRLAGLALSHPVTLKAVKDFKGIVVPKPKSNVVNVQDDSTMAVDDEMEEVEAMSKGDHSKISFTPPTQLVHNYVVCPPKLRFVGLVALLRRLLVTPTSAGKKGPGTKVLIFLSCTAAVDFYWEALGAMNMGSSAPPAIEENKVESAKERVEREKREVEEQRTKLASRSSVIPGVPIYRLHGNLELETRLNSLKAFANKSEVVAGKNKGNETENAVLLCTSVAARGLDVPFVSHVVQYDLPTEGGVTEYIHRVGRTARAGASGQATSFLLPSEKEWVPWVETGMRDGAVKREAKDVKLREIGIEDVLKSGYGGEGREYETRATDVQMGFERWVAEEDEHATLARNAFASHIRAYATHPSSEKAMFNVKALHLGHLAKSFGMREAPGAHNAPKSKKSKHSIGREESREKKSMPSKGDAGFATGRRDTGPKNLKQLMRGPTGDSEFHVASKEMLESMAKSTGGRRKR